MNEIGHSKYYYAVFATLTALCVLLGVYLSQIQFLESEWLSRAGCIIVILGIWSGMGGIFQERIFLTRMKWRRGRAIVTIKAQSTSAAPDLLEKELEAINEAFDKEISEITQKLKFSVGLLEVILLITGTFLWGFGDLMMRFLI